MPLRSQGKWEGPYRPIAPDANSDNPWHSCCEIAHAVLIGKPGRTQGKVLIIQGNGARWIWDPASSMPPYSELPPVDPEHHTWADWRLQHSNFEIYTPDYLLHGKRPEIQLLQSPEWGYGEAYEIAVHLPGASQPALEIGSVCLMSPGSVTHHYDWDQRYVGLHHSPSATHPSTRLVIDVPASPNMAPPGWYMLFVVTNGASTGGVRIPSIAKFIKLQ